MAKKIMFQGTGSSVGKSITVAAVCRILSNRGMKVAPFKSQNMALNSFITADGKEMGRAQVVQAEAARVLPRVEMNPILLKPTSDVGSQVILNGVVYDQMGATQYFSAKELMIPHILNAYQTLANEYDVIVIEGAGSPAEINLRSRDVVNMGLAELIDTDVILIGDVDKGGVFASLYGTFLLLSESEQQRVKGFLINKFRGDVSLLMPGVEMLTQLIDRPCLGVVPYIDNLKIDDEDSVTERFNHGGSESTMALQIAVVKLPYMSNFTDFTVFDLEKDVNLYYATSEQELMKADLVIIPGSKNTIIDMEWLIKTGLNQAIYKVHRKETPIIGICGGFQILGKTIADPHGVESSVQMINGLGLLDVETVMALEKTTRQAKGYLLDHPLHLQHPKWWLSGYEIHMGETTLCSNRVKPFLMTDSGHYDGAVDASNTVKGTYFHGIFDNDHYRTTLLAEIRARKGMTAEAEALDYNDLKDKEYERLAAHVEAHLDMPFLLELLSGSRD